MINVEVIGLELLDISKFFILWHFFFMYKFKPRKHAIAIPFVLIGAIFIMYHIHYLTHGFTSIHSIYQFVNHHFYREELNFITQPHMALVDVLLRYVTIVFLSSGLYVTSKTQLLLKNFLSMLLIASLDTLSLSISRMLIQYYDWYMMDNTILEHLVTIFFLLITGLLLKLQKSNGFREVSDIRLGLFTLGTFVYALTSAYFHNIVLTISEGVLTTDYEMVILIFAIGIYVQIILFVLLLSSREIFRKNEELALMYLNTQSEHFSYMEHQIERTRKLRHDMNHHIQLLNQLHKDNNQEEFDNYLGELTEQLDSLKPTIQVHHPVMNAIINQFNVKAQKENIGFKVTGFFPVECEMSTYDLCTIFSNLLDNALCAQKEVGNGTIQVEFRHTQTNIFAVIENTHTGNLVKEDGFFRTTKENTFEHGFGMSNVYECIKKNGGHLRIITTPEHFKCNVLIHVYRDDAKVN